MKSILLTNDLVAYVNDFGVIERILDMSIPMTIKPSYNNKELFDIDINESSYEEELQVLYPFLKKHNRKLLNGKEIDLYDEEKKIGIEFNGNYWHNEYNKNKKYHQEKSLLAEKKGVFLFHIFEHEWDDKFLKKNKDLDLKKNILNRIQTILKLNTQTIGARKCEIKLVPKEEKNRFLNENHMQGAEKHSSYALGLYYKDELVACMTFGKSKFKKYNWDLMRFCSKHGFNIQGGASRLFNYFVKNYVTSGETIVSYSDITKTIGSLYQTLGFELKSVNAPNYWWVNLDNYEILSRYSTQIPNEVETMHEAGYCCVSDCGTKTWLYTKK